MKTHIRQKFVVANWKMHTTTFEANALATGIVDGIGHDNTATVILCPPFPYLALVGNILSGSGIDLGAQNMYPEAEGAFTGEVSPPMLLDLGCKYVILGHSERRHTLNESDVFINQKVLYALASGLYVILCVGETLEQRQAKQTEAVIDRQLSSGLDSVPHEILSRLSIAYEPVWAIGTGRNASPQQAQAVHHYLRSRIAAQDAKLGSRVRILYGGSVKASNAAELLSMPDVDGGLVGGASLSADEFLQICAAAAARH